MLGLVLIGCRPSARAAEAETPAAPSAQAEHEVGASEPVVPDWLEDARVRAHLADGLEPREPEPAAEQTVRALVREPGLQVALVRQLWREDQEAWRRQTGRADLVFGMPSAAAVVRLGRAYQDGSPDELGDPSPRVVEAKWQGVGSPGPDLVVVVESTSQWETQCEIATDHRTDVIVCELEPPAVSCGIAAVELEYYDGCGGRESVDFMGEESPCARVGFSVAWSLGEEALELEVVEAKAVECLDAESAVDARAPLSGPRVTYRELVSQETSRIDVVTITSG